MSGSKLKIKWQGSIILGGPANLEANARQQLESILYKNLSRCYYLDDSMRAAFYAQKIASEVPYQIKGNKVVIKINVDVSYQNPPMPWKWWISLRTNKEGSIVNKVNPGDIR